LTETPEPIKTKAPSTGRRWAIAMALIGLACLLVPILLIRAAMNRVRGLGDVAGSAVNAARDIAAAFRTGTVETSLRSYATTMKGVSRFQFAELRQLESFERTDKTSIAWGAIPLPDVVVEARGQVVYTYVLDFQKRWDIRLADGRIEVVAPAPEPVTPALDPSSLVFEIKSGSVLRDEEAVRKSLQAGLGELLTQRARDHLPLVRETGRKATEEFVRNFLISNYDGGASMPVTVRFADEAPITTRPQTQEGARLPPLSIEGTSAQTPTPKP
jgi:hypothetical protein